MFHQRCGIASRDPALIDNALEQRVVLCSPLTLFAFLGVIRQAFDNFMVEQTSDQILALIGKFGVQWQKYNDAVDKVKARFDQVDGFVELDRKQGQGRADISIDLGSISSGTPDFDAHLKSADFFDVAKAPTARFVGSKFAFDGDKPTAVSGELTLLGKTMPVTLKGTRFNCYDQPVLKVHVCGGDFETTIERSQWGMNWGLDMGVPDQVRLLVQIEAIRK